MHVYVPLQVQTSVLQSHQTPRGSPIVAASSRRCSNSSTSRSAKFRLLISSCLLTVKTSLGLSCPTHWSVEQWNRLLTAFRPASRAPLFRRRYAGHFDRDLGPFLAMPLPRTGASPLRRVVALQRPLSIDCFRIHTLGLALGPAFRQQ